MWRRPGKALGDSIGPHAPAGAFPNATHCSMGAQTHNVTAKSLAPSLKQCFNE